MRQDTAPLGPELVQRYERAQRDVTELAARQYAEQTDGGRIRVTVAGNGTVLEVKVGRRAATETGEELGARVLAAVRTARARYQQEANAVAQRMFRDTDAPAESGRGRRQPMPALAGYSAGDLLQEMRKLTTELPRLIESVTRRSASAQRANGAVRATSTTAGEVTALDIDTRFLRTAAPWQVNHEITCVLREAQAAAARQVEGESFEFLGLPLGEVVTGKRPLSDLFSGAGTVAAVTR